MMILEVVNAMGLHLKRRSGYCLLEIAVCTLMISEKSTRMDYLLTILVFHFILAFD